MVSRVNEHLREHWGFYPLLACKWHRDKRTKKAKGHYYWNRGIN